MVIRIDLTGKRFGRLVVTGFSGVHKGGQSKWLARCDCGVEKSFFGYALSSGNTSSCGCYQKEDREKRLTKHGLHKHPLYRVWGAMNARCHCETNKAYKDYGGRGIRVCREWRESFASFLQDVGERPWLGATLDRIDNDGCYEPGNVRWTTRQEQAWNTRQTRIVAIDGKKYALSELAAKSGISKNVVSWRVRNGWTLETALSTPPQFTGARARME